MRPRRMARMATSIFAIVLPDTTPLEEDMSKSDIKRTIGSETLSKAYQMAIEAGWRVVPTGSSKLTWYPPDKSKSPIVTSVDVNGRGLNNALTMLSRGGLDTTALRGVHKPKEDCLDTMIDKSAAQGSTLVSEAIANVKTGQDAVDDAMAHFISDAVGALMEYTDALGLTAVGGDIEAKIEEAEKLYLETCAELETVQNQLKKALTDLSRVGGELQTALTEKNEQMERANKAENKLRVFRSALLED